MPSPSPLSFIPTIVGFAMAWTGMWLAGPPALAAVITVGTLILFGGSLMAGPRRRRAAEGRSIDPEQAWATYRTMRTGAIFSVVMTPFIIVMVGIYLDPPLARWLSVGGLTVLFIDGIRSHRLILAHMRDRAEQASSAQATADAPRVAAGSRPGA